MMVKDILESTGAYNYSAELHRPTVLEELRKKQQLQNKENKTLQRESLSHFVAPCQKAGRTIVLLDVSFGSSVAAVRLLSPPQHPPPPRPSGNGKTGVNCFRFHVTLRNQWGRASRAGSCRFPSLEARHAWASASGLQHRPVCREEWKSASSRRRRTRARCSCIIANDRIAHLWKVARRSLALRNKGNISLKKIQKPKKAWAALSYLFSQRLSFRPHSARCDAP